MATEFTTFAIDKLLTKRILKTAMVITYKNGKFRFSKYRNQFATSKYDHL